MPSKKIILPGTRFGKLTVLSEARNCGRTASICACDCGNTDLVVLNCNLSSGYSTSCGCSRRKPCLIKRRAITPGSTFGALTVLRPGEMKFGHSTSVCVCVCGKKIVLRNAEVRNHKSCGCLTNVKHGLSGTKIYNVWHGMMGRCYRRDNKAWKDYGGRGIKVCDRWQDVAAFYADIGDPPTLRHTLERNDSNGNYEPNNCRWATPQEQMRNTRHNHRVEVNGVAMILSDALSITGISDQGFRMRVRRGWSESDALSIPPYQKRSPTVDSEELLCQA